MASEVAEVSYCVSASTEITVAVIAAAVVICGWLHSSWSQRVLQRKQLAVNILSQDRFQEKWVDSLAGVFEIIRNDEDFDWVEVAHGCLSSSKKITDEQQKIYENIKYVLNYLEFIAIAVHNRAIDEDIIRWSYNHYYTTLSHVLKNHIETTRDLLKDDEIYINFTTLAEKWRKKPTIAKPGSGWW